jgi:endonuclease-3
MLSAQTKDAMTAMAMKRLREHGLTISSILAISELDLNRLIQVVGFHKKKAK